MQVRFKPTEQQINDAVTLLLRRRALFFGGVVALLAALALFFFTQRQFSLLAYFFVLAAVLAVAIIVRFRITTRRNLLQAYDDLGDQPLYTIDSQGITIQSKGANHFMRWSTFEQVIQDAKTIILVQPSRSIFVLPRDVFDEQQQRILAAHLEYIGTARAS